MRKREDETRKGAPVGASASEVRAWGLGEKRRWMLPVTHSRNVPRPFWYVSGFLPFADGVDHPTGPEIIEDRIPCGP